MIDNENNHNHNYKHKNNLDWFAKSLAIKFLAVQKLVVSYYDKSCWMLQESIRAGRLWAVRLASSPSKRNKANSAAIQNEVLNVIKELIKVKIAEIMEEMNGDPYTSDRLQVQIDRLLKIKEQKDKDPYTPEKLQAKIDGIMMMKEQSSREDACREEVKQGVANQIINKAF